jgi:hypothetical protein
LTPFNECNYTILLDGDHYLVSISDVLWIVSKF